MSSHPVIILGNGPSSKGLDLHRLGTPTIGLSGAYAEWQAINFRPTYYVCLNEEEGPSHAEAIDQLVRENRIRRFLLRDSACRLIGKSPRILNYDQLRDASAFFAVDPVSTGSHALLFAVALGYRLVGLTGVDLDHLEKAPSSEAETAVIRQTQSGSVDPTHDAVSSPDPTSLALASQPYSDAQLLAWKNVGWLAASAGVRVFNVSESSYFDQFPHLSLVDFRSLAVRLSH